MVNCISILHESRPLRDRNRFVFCGNIEVLIFAGRCLKQFTYMQETIRKLGFIYNLYTVSIYDIFMNL